MLTLQVYQPLDRGIRRLHRTGIAEACCVALAPKSTTSLYLGMSNIASTYISANQFEILFPKKGMYKTGRLS